MDNLRLSEKEHSWFGLKTCIHEDSFEVFSPCLETVVLDEFDPDKCLVGNKS